MSDSTTYWGTREEREAWLKQVVAQNTDPLGNDLRNTHWVGGTPYPTDMQSNQQDPNGWAWAVLNRCGVSLIGFDPIQGNMVFQHQDRMPFSPFTSEKMSFDNLFMLAVIFKGLTKDNYAAFTKLVGDYMQNVGRAITAVSSMGDANWANHTSSTMLMASMLHRLGMLDDQGLVRVQEHCRTIFDKMWQKDVALGALGGVTSLAKTVGETIAGTVPG